MLLPCLFYIVVDVVTTVADGITTCQSGLLVVNVICGRWNSHCQLYGNCSSVMLTRTSSHMCGRWYLPMFLFRDGLFLLM